MIAGNPNNIHMTKLLLQSLLLGWTPNVALLAANLTSDNENLAGNFKDSYLNQQKSSIELITHSWEWKEGRLMAYELIMNYLLKNHWFYTFGFPLSSGIASPTEMSKLAPTSSHTPVRSASQCEDRDDSISMNFPLKTSNSNPNLSENKDKKKVHHSPSSDTEVEQEDATPPSKGLIPCLRDMVEAMTYYTDPYPPFDIPALPSILESHGVSSILEKCAIPSSDNVHIESATDRHDSGKRSDCHKDTRGRHTCKNKLGISILLKNGFKQTEWAAAFQLPSMEDILTIILDQTLECLTDPQWELQRMGNQLLPPLLEVIRWYDMNILVKIWNSRITLEPNVYSFGACLALRDWSFHCRKLLPLLKEEDAGCYKTQKSSLALKKLVKTLKSEDLSVWIFILKQQLMKNNFDKHAIVIIEVLMSLNSLSAIHNSLKRGSNQKMNFLRKQLIGTPALVNKVMIQLFLKAHPNTRVAGVLKKDAASEGDPVKLEPVTSPLLQFSFSNHSKSSSTPDTLLLLARQAENTLLNRVQPLLFDYISAVCSQDPASFVRFLPILLFHVDCRLSDDLFVKDFMDSFRLILRTLSEERTGSSVEEDVITVDTAPISISTRLGKAVLPCLCICLEQLIDIFSSGLSELPASLCGSQFEDYFAIISLMVYGKLVKNAFSSIKEMRIEYSGRQNKILLKALAHSISGLGKIVKKCESSPRPNTTRLPWRQV